MLNHLHHETSCGELVNFKVIGEIDKHLVYRIDDYIVLGDVLFVNFINFSARFDVFAHSRNGYDIPDFKRGIVFKFLVDKRFTLERAVRRVFSSLSVYVANFSDDFEKPRSAGDSVSFERGRHGETNGLFRSRAVRHDKINAERVETSLNALNRRKKRFKIYRGVYSVFLSGFVHALSIPHSADKINSGRR